MRTASRPVRVAAVLVGCLLSSGCGGLLGGAGEAEQLQQGERTVDSVREQVGRIEEQRGDQELPSEEG